MSNVFIGLVLSFLDFYLEFGASRVGLIPDFIGFIFILKGVNELEVEVHSSRLIKLKPYISGMTLYSIVIYVVDLLGVYTMIDGLVYYILGVVSTIVTLYITFGIIMTVFEMEKKQHWTLNAASLYSAWRILAIFSILVYSLLIIPTLAYIAGLAGLVMNIVFLVYFSKTKNLYYKQSS